jgi:signal transduction histidine kinase
MFTSPRLDGGATTFEVRIAGAADAAWHATSGRSASFASFAPGTYTLEIRARDAAGRTADVARVVVDVPPRFVETTAFRVLAAAIAASLVLAFGLLRLRAVERARRTLARTVDERTRELASRNADLEARTRELDAALADLKRAETDLVRAERMASVATLVRGIAHELNNPLGFVAGNVAPLRRYAEFLVRAVHDVASGGARLEEVRLSPRKDLAFVERDLDKLLADMEEGARRAKLIVADLQSLTSPLGAAGRTIERVDVARVVAQSVRLLAPSKPAGVTVTVDAPPCEPICARAGEIEQAVVVLVDNALRAVGAAGTIGVRLSAIGAARIIEVEDDGPGMTEEVRRRAVEPFFTTRPAGEGSGLGLAIAAGVAEHHRGALEIDSAPGRGTRVRLTVRDAA